MVFSSSAATFGTPDVDLVTEETADAPRVAVRREQADRRVADARPGPGATGLRHTSLRYFNVVGSGSRRPLRHQPAQPVPARLRDAARAGETPRINGDDYPTPDGTCVRDYVHVADLAAAHVAAAQRLAAGDAAASRSTTSAAATGVSVAADHGRDAAA